MKKQLAKILSLTLLFTTYVTPSYASSSFTANAVPNPEGNFIALNWNSPDPSKPYSYIVYQQHEGEETYQSIPSTEEVKALEVYPVKSSLKGWVEKYGKGKITCDSISMDEFNVDPSIMWNYDVIVFGFYDMNGSKDLTLESKAELEKYMNTGRGVLFGHDTISIANPNFKSLASYVNIAMGNKLSSTGNKVYINRRGLLTNYPYEIGDIGTELTIPYSHVSRQNPSGDIWMKFTCNDQFYLTTWNNCAMIQTGHSNGAATPDEQRLLMNTIFYLAQITQDTCAELHMGQDLTGPTLPELVNSDVKYGDETITLELASTDRGDTYNYYVEATNIRNDEKQESSKTTATITTGLKGYSIVVNNSPNTIPDNVIETEDGNYVAHFDKTKAVYVHVKAIDNVGNASEVLHYAINDTIAPTMPALEKVDDTFVLVPGEDNESGIAKHEYRLNNGEWKTWDGDMDLTALEDNEYTLEVKAVDYAGNESGIYAVDFKTIYRQVAAATEAVEKVEEDFTVDDYKHAKELVDALDEGDIKDALKERLDKVADEHNDEIVLDEIEKIKEKLSDEDIRDEEFKETAKYFEEIKDKADTVTDETIKERVDKLVEEIEEIIANKKYHLTEDTFDLTVTPKPEDNNVDLDWTPATDDPLLDYTYRIYSQKNDDSFQSIPAIDTVKVLEIYPNQSHLKKWVREYDTIGKISCRSISIEEFMTKPEIVWNYDVIVFGFEDSYMGKDLDEVSVEIVKQFIESGRGVLFSHDALSTVVKKPNLNTLASYLNLEISGGEKYKGQTEAYIAQTGGIVNYPYMVGKLGDDITLPLTHPVYQVPHGDVWVRYNLDDQFYLTTWNNCAMIQTGHKPADTNESEQKLLLNTLYYLAQVTDQTEWNDYMGQDVDKPTTPELSNIETETPDSQLSLDITSEDQGTSYNYYVEATCVEDNTKITTTTKSAIMTSGLKGYSILIDEEENTIPDDEIETTADRYAVLADFTKPFYVHVKAIDNVGNSSETVHYYYTDTKAPTMPLFEIEEDVLKLIPGEDYGFGIDQQLYSVNDSEWQEWRGDINLLELEDGEYTFIVKATDKAQHESESYTYVINITCHQDAVDTAQKLDDCKAIFEDETISEEEFATTLSEFEALKVQANRLQKVDSSLVDKVAAIEEILAQREVKGEEEPIVPEETTGEAKIEDIEVPEETTTGEVKIEDIEVPEETTTGEAKIEDIEVPEETTTGEAKLEEVAESEETITGETTSEKTTTEGSTWWVDNQPTEDKWWGNN